MVIAPDGLYGQGQFLWGLSCIEGRSKTRGRMANLAFLRGFDPVNSPDLLGDQSLQPPEVAVADPLLLQMLYGEIEIFGTRPHMSACPGENFGNVIERQSAQDTVAFRPAQNTSAREGPCCV